MQATQQMKLEGNIYGVLATQRMCKEQLKLDRDDQEVASSAWWCE